MVYSISDLRTSLNTHYSLLPPNPQQTQSQTLTSPPPSTSTKLTNHTDHMIKALLSLSGTSGLSPDKVPGPLVGFYEECLSGFLGVICDFYTSSGSGSGDDSGSGEYSTMSLALLSSFFNLPSPSPTTPSIPHDEYTITIPSPLLGLTVENVLERTIIRTILPTGSASHAGAKVGSLIVKVGRRNVEGLTHFEVIEELRQSQRPLVLKLRVVGDEVLEEGRREMGRLVMVSSGNGGGNSGNGKNGSHSPASSNSYNTSNGNSPSLTQASASGQANALSQQPPSIAGISIELCRVLVMLIIGYRCYNVDGGADGDNSDGGNSDSEENEEYRLNQIKAHSAATSLSKILKDYIKRCNNNASNNNNNNNNGGSSGGGMNKSHGHHHGHKKTTSISPTPQTPLTTPPIQAPASTTPTIEMTSLPSSAPTATTVTTTTATISTITTTTTSSPSPPTTITTSPSSPSQKPKTQNEMKLPLAVNYGISPDDNMSVELSFNDSDTNASVGVSVIANVNVDTSIDINIDTDVSIDLNDNLKAESESDAVIDVSSDSAIGAVLPSPPPATKRTSPAPATQPAAAPATDAPLPSPPASPANPLSSSNTPTTSANTTSPTSASASASTPPPTAYVNKSPKDYPSFHFNSSINLLGDVIQRCQSLLIDTYSPANSNANANANASEEGKCTCIKKKKQAFTPVPYVYPLLINLLTDLLDLDVDMELCSGGMNDGDGVSGATRINNSGSGKNNGGSNGGGGGGSGSGNGSGDGGKKTEMSTDDLGCAGNLMKLLLRRVCGESEDSHANVNGNGNGNGEGSACLKCSNEADNKLKNSTGGIMNALSRKLSKNSLKPSSITIPPTATAQIEEEVVPYYLQTPPPRSPNSILQIVHLLASSPSVSSRCVSCSLSPILWKAIDFPHHLQLRGVVTRSLHDVDVRVRRATARVLEEIVETKTFDVIVHVHVRDDGNTSSAAVAVAGSKSKKYKINNPYGQSGSDGVVPWLVLMCERSMTDPVGELRGGTVGLVWRICEKVKSERGVFDSANDGSSEDNDNTRARKNSDTSSSQIYASLHLLQCKLLPIMTRLADDKSPSVRLSVASQVDRLTRALGVKWLVVIVDLFFGLLGDSEVGVRIEAVYCISRLVRVVFDIEREHDLEQLQIRGAGSGSGGALQKEVLSSLFMTMTKMLNDDSYKVRVALATSSGELLVLLRNCKGFPDSGSAGNSGNSGSNSNSGAADSSLHVHYIDESLLPLVQRLLHDPSPEVCSNALRAVANASNSINGNDEENDFLPVLKEKQILRLLPTLTMLSTNEKWRVRRSAVEVVPALVKSTGSKARAEIGKLCVALLSDPVADVRVAAYTCMCLASSRSSSSGNSSSSRKDDWLDYIVIPHLKLCKLSHNYRQRLVAVGMLRTLIGNSGGGEVINYFGMLIEMAEDSIPNVRLNVGRAFSTIGWRAICIAVERTGKGKGEREKAGEMRKRVEECFAVMRTSGDGDCRYYADFNLKEK